MRKETSYYSSEYKNEKIMKEFERIYRNNKKTKKLEGEKEYV
ncbi:hypothetical protein [Crassaminicella thermophila]|nr:hypothetical protein [Crassaminicella thermophila]